MLGWIDEDGIMALRTHCFVDSEGNLATYWRDRDREFRGDPMLLDPKKIVWEEMIFAQDMTRPDTWLDVAASS
jgi:hypothetical protein